MTAMLSGVKTFKDAVAPLLLGPMQRDEYNNKLLKVFYCVIFTICLFFAAKTNQRGL